MGALLPQRGRDPRSRDERVAKAAPAASAQGFLSKKPRPSSPEPELITSDSGPIDKENKADAVLVALGMDETKTLIGVMALRNVNAKDFLVAWKAIDDPREKGVDNLVAEWVGRLPTSDPDTEPLAKELRQDLQRLSLNDKQGWTKGMVDGVVPEP